MFKKKKYLKSNLYKSYSKFFDKTQHLLTFVQTNFQTKVCTTDKAELCC